MKISEIAKRYNIDTTELVCAIGALGQELTPDDEIDLNEEMAKGISEMLGVEISPIVEGNEGSGPAEGGGETAGVSESAADAGPQSEKEQDSKEEKKVDAEPQEQGPEKKAKATKKTKRKADKGQDTTAEAKTQNKDQQGAESGQSQAEATESPPASSQEEGDERQEKKSDETPVEGADEAPKGQEGSLKEEGKSEDKPQDQLQQENEKQVGQEKGQPQGLNDKDETDKVEQRAPGQRGSEPDGRGNGKEAAQASQNTENTPGGQTDVPEDGGDERRALLGDAEPPSDPATKIVLEEGKEIPVKEEVVQPTLPEEPPAPQEGVPIVEEATDRTDAAGKEKPKAAFLPKLKVPLPIVLAIGGGIVLVLMLSFVIAGVSSGKKEKVYSVKVSMKDYEVFAAIEKAVEKGKLSTAEDLFSALKERFPNSRLLDDAAISIADGYFTAAEGAGSQQQEYLEHAAENYKFAIDTTEMDQVKEYASFRYAKTLYNMGRIDEAIGAYKRFMEDFSYSKYGAEAVYDMAMGYLDGGKQQEAKLELWKFVAKYYDDARVLDAYLTLAEIFDKEKSDKDVQQLIDTVLPKLKDFPKKLRFYFLLAKSYIRQNDLAKAADLLSAHLEEADKSQFGDEYYATLANAYFALHKPAVGIKIAIALSRKFPSSPLAPELLMRAGAEAMRIKDYNSAREIFFIVKEKYYKLDSAPDALVFLAKIAAIEGDFLEAIKWGEELLAKYPEYKGYNDALWRLAKYYQLNGEHEQAALKYTEVAMKAQDARVKEKVWIRVIESYIRAKMYSKAAQVCRQVLDEYKESQDLDRGRIVYMLGISFWGRNQYADAIANFKYCISAFPLSPWRFNARYMLAKTYEEIQETTSAITNYELLAKNRFIPDRRLRVLSYLGLARMYTGLEMWDEAKAALRDAMQINRDWDAHNNILLTEAKLNVKLGAYGKAENLLKSYISRLLAKYNMAIEEDSDGIRLVLKDKNPHYNKELAVYDVALGFIRIGDVYFAKGDYKKANDVYRNAEKMLTTNGVAVTDWLLYQLANTSAKIDRIDDANAYITRLKEEFPESAWAKEADYILSSKEVDERLKTTKESIEALLK